MAEMKLKKTGLVAAGFAAGALITALLRYPPGNSSEWASWVQAVGSIAAIGWAGKFAGDQMTAQRELQEDAARNACAHRLETFLALCEVARADIDVLTKILTGGDRGPNWVVSDSPNPRSLLHYVNYVYEAKTFDGMSSALGAFPIHELPDARSVGTAQRFRDGFMHASKATAEWVKAMNENGKPSLTEGQEVVRAAYYLRAQETYLHSCLQGYRRQA